jgi:hypothetical protein
MAKSLTRKKSKVKTAALPQQVADIKQQVDRAVQYVDNWKMRELQRMATNQKGPIPICVPIGKTAYVVGLYGVRKDGLIWTTINSRDDSTHSFSRRASAIVYTLCNQTGHKRLAKDILQHDTNVIKITEELETLSYKKSRALSKKDYWRLDHFDIMSSSAEFRLDDAKTLLEKSMHLAKYFKIWNSL